MRWKEISYSLFNEFDSCVCVCVCVCLESIILHQQNFDIYMWDMNNNNGIDDNNKMIFVIQILFRNNNGPEGL